MDFSSLPAVVGVSRELSSELCAALSESYEFTKNNASASAATMQCQNQASNILLSIGARMRGHAALCSCDKESAAK